MSRAFDPYYQWLGIPPKQQPPNHYRLLGIELFEDNADVIERAADRQMGHVRTYQTGRHASDSQRLLNEISAARVCLIDPAKRSHYDEQLRRQLEAEHPSANASGAAGLDIRIEEPAGAKAASAYSTHRARRRPIWAQPAFLGTVVLVASVIVMLALSSYLASRNRHLVDSEPYPLPDFQLDESTQRLLEEGSFKQFQSPSNAAAMRERNELADPPVDPSPDVIEDAEFSQYQPFFDNALGTITQRYAICQAMAVTEFMEKATELRAVGYRPTKVRPYRTKNGIYVAAIWTRDAVPYRMLGGVDVATVENADSLLRQEGFVPMEAVGLPTGTPRCLAVWARLPVDADARRMQLAIPEDPWNKMCGDLASAGYMPLTVHHLGGSVSRCCSIWEKRIARNVTECWSGTEPAFRERLAQKCMPIDISLRSGTDGTLVCSAVIQPNEASTCQVIFDLSWNHFQQCREPVHSGLRPVAISVFENPADNTCKAVSVWRSEPSDAPTPRESPEQDADS